MFSGTFESWRATIAPTSDHDDRRGGRGGRREAEAPLARPEADHDEDHLGALEEDALEGDGEPDGVALRA